MEIYYGMTVMFDCRFCGLISFLGSNTMVSHVQSQQDTKTVKLTTEIPFYLAKFKLLFLVNTFLKTHMGQISPIVFPTLVFGILQNGFLVKYYF